MENSRIYRKLQQHYISHYEDTLYYFNILVFYIKTLFYRNSYFFPRSGKKWSFEIRQI